MGFPDWSCLASARGNPSAQAPHRPARVRCWRPLAIAFSSSAETGSLRPRESTPRWRGTSNSTPRVQIGGMAVASPAVGPKSPKWVRAAPQNQWSSSPIVIWASASIWAPEWEVEVRTRTYSRDRRRCPAPRAESARDFGCPAETGRSGPETADGPGRAACQESGPPPGNRTSLHARLLGCRDASDRWALWIG